MGKMEELVPQAMMVYREIMDDMDAKENVRADVASKVLESEGYLRTPKSDGGRTFVLNLKTDDVVGALQGMRTVFGGEGELPAPEPEPVRKIEPVKKEKEKKVEQPRKTSDKDILKRAIEAERGVVSTRPSAEEREDPVHGEGDV